MDAFFTPPQIASLMVDAFEITDAAIVIDPTAGDGALLRSAAYRWPNARLLGTDIDGTRVQQLRERGYEVESGDFLDQHTAHRLAGRTRDAPSTSVLLNPPFSSRGATTYTAGGSTGAVAITGSRAMAFLLGASALVGERGQLVALLPAGVITSARDATGRDWLQEHGELTLVTRPSKRAFRGAVVETAVMRWTPCASRPELLTPDNREVAREDMSWVVVRGGRQMHTVQPALGPNSVPLVHTTHLQRGQITARPTHIRPNHRERVVCGPAILIPRVGRPDVRKIVLHLGGPIALSDCLFAICHPDEDSCAWLHKTLITAFDGLRDRYGGTGAPYLRRLDLVALVAKLTRHPQPVEPNPPRLVPDGLNSSQAAVATLTKMP